MAEQAIALDQFHEASWRLALQADYALGLPGRLHARSLTGPAGQLIASTAHVGDAGTESSGSHRDYWLRACHRELRLGR
jgi:hypothetical protein